MRDMAYPLPYAVADQLWRLSFALLVLGWTALSSVDGRSPRGAGKNPLSG